MLTVTLLAVATGFFLALGIALFLEKAPDRLLSIFIILMAVWLFGSTLAAFFVQ
jgi:hypothetical protein